MTEVRKDSAPTHAYLVAGGGGGMRSTIILRMLAKELGARGIPYTPVEGIRGTGGEQAVHVPSQQVADMEAHIAAQPENTRVLLISHCIGTVAGMTTLERVADRQPAGLVSIAPPLPSPRHTIDTPQSSKKRSEGNTRMRVVDLPPDAVDYSAMTESTARISPQYFADIDAAADLGDRLRSGVESGTVAVCAPEYDWNVESPATVQGWHEDWEATLPPDEAALLRNRARIVYDAAHGLYLSPRSGREITIEDDIKFQLDNVRSAIDTGLDLLDTQPLPR